MRLPREFAELPRIRELLIVSASSTISSHSAVLYLAGKISPEELSGSIAEQQVRAISDKEFILISNADQLYALAELECDEEVLCVGQILDANDDAMAHSFILAKKGGDFICFDKAGTKEPFRVYHLGDLMKTTNYRNQLWRFLPLKEVV